MGDSYTVNVRVKKLSVKCMTVNCTIYTLMPKLCDIQNRMCMSKAGVSFGQNDWAAVVF